jgi:hypothetical protein
VDGSCTAGAGGDSGGMKKHYIGLHGAFDLLYQGGQSDACSPDSTDTSCFALGDKFPATLNGVTEDPWNDQKTQSGFAPGQVRILLSYDYALNANMMVGVRAGYAFLGAPEGFMPVQAGARFRYIFGGLDQPGFHPYVGAGGGMAEVNGRVKKTGVATNFTDPDNDPNTAPNQEPLDVDIYTQAGTGYVEVGPGFLWNLSSHINLELNLNAMVMLPTFGINVQPSLGLVYAL